MGQWWEVVQETGLEAEDESRSGRHIWRRKTHQKVEDASRGIGRQKMHWEQKWSLRRKGVA